MASHGAENGNDNASEFRSLFTSIVCYDARLHCTVDAFLLCWITVLRM